MINYELKIVYSQVTATNGLLSRLEQTLVDR